MNLGLYYLDKTVTNLGYQRKDLEQTAGEVTETVRTKASEAMTFHGSRFFLRIGGLSGAAAVSLAAYGAHGKSKITLYKVLVILRGFKYFYYR